MPLKVTAMCDQFSPKVVDETTVCRFIPSKIENVATLCGSTTLFMRSSNVFSLLITVSSAEPFA